MSELSPLGLLNPLDAPRDGSCGLAVPNTTFKVVDVSTGHNLEPKKEGEICCKGPMVIIQHMIKQITCNMVILYIKSVREIHTIFITILSFFR